MTSEANRDVGGTVERTAVQLPWQPLRAWRSDGFWAAGAHLALSFVMGFVGLGLTICVVVSAALVPVLLVGVLLLVPCLALTSAFGWLERGRYAVALGLQIPAPRTPVGTGWWRRGRAILVDGGTWRTVLYTVLLFPLTAVSFAVLVAVWSGALALVLLPVYYRFLNSGTAHIVFFEVRSLAPAVVIAVAALAAALALIPIVTRALFGLNIVVARSLLGTPRSAELTERVVELTESRSRVVDAAEQERRRMERDLHDGAQQRLVAMSMTVGRLSSRLKKAGDVEALALADEAQSEVRQAITELRDLTRGLHPPVLTDRGLDAALSAIAARSPVPVTVRVDLPERPSLTVESIAYFFVSEALTNVAKHAAATAASVSVRSDGASLRVTVSDNGRGGADFANGTGLTGLAGRAAGVDGTLTVSSPLGGPTVLEMELPCAS